ncbi:MAG TPA: Rieske (2Fe-2S) protein [Planctomycetota bacterium]|nr:Rieske (2Fe-2S) protein [Planctomycetota bacterium]
MAHLGAPLPAGMTGRPVRTDRRPDRWIRVASAAELAPGRSLRIQVEGEEGLLHQVEGRIYCTGSVCPHQGRSLATGQLEGTLFTCPWHAWVFDVTTGRSPYALGTSIGCLPVKVEGGEIFVGLSGIEGGGSGVP